MIKTEEIEYRDEETICRGFLAYDDQNTTPSPCILLAHDWGGRGKTICNKAIELATIGYVGFAIDMYGQAKLGRDKTEKRALLTPLRENRKQVATRMTAAFTTVNQLPQVDTTKIAAMGYCFGGMCILDLARTGATIKGAVSFHGLLTAPPETVITPIPAKILVLHGYDDPLVLPEAVNQFALEMTARKADWQIHMYGLTQHSFTDPKANDDELGLHYNACADRRSWQSTELFLQEIFA